MNIKEIENLINASHQGSYESGHMGAQILRFVSRESSELLVVKFAPQNDAGAMTDIQANIDGYRAIQSVGAEDLVPSLWKEISVGDGKLLVMKDLGKSLRLVDEGLPIVEVLWKSWLKAVVYSINKSAHKSGGIPDYVNEVVGHMDRFSHNTVPKLVTSIRDADWTDENRTDAIMLLDFTPDNLFLNDGKLSFIDPWPQRTYLGHPAVSIGQLSALVRLYQMKDADQIASELEKRCLTEMREILACTNVSIQRALRLGATLQYVLSSYVRQKTDPVRANKILNRAHELWN